MESTAIFEKMKLAVSVAGADIVKKAKAVIKFVIKEDAENPWILDLKTGNGKVEQGDGKADVTFTMADADFVAMSEGKLDGQSAFMSGKLKLKGNMAIAMRLSSVLSALQEAGEKAIASNAAPANEDKLESTAIFKDMVSTVEASGAQLVKSTKAIIAFKIKEDDEEGSWVLDLKNGNGRLYQGKDKGDVTIIMADKDFVAMSQGKLDGQSAFMSGKLKLKGNMAIAMKLGSILTTLRGSKL